MPAVHLQTLEPAAACGHTVKLSTCDLEAVTCKSCLKAVLRPPVPPKPVYPKVAHIFFTKVAGVTFPNADGTSRQKIIARCRDGEELDLWREYGSQHDARAIQVVTKSNEQIGYLPAHVSPGLADYMDRGDQYRCRVAAITGGGVRWLGVNIEITDGEWSAPVPIPADTDGGTWLPTFLAVMVIITAILIAIAKSL